MKLYAKIVRHPSLSTREYEYRYRCCNSEFYLEFTHNKKRGYRRRGCMMLDLRIRKGDIAPAMACPACGEAVPDPWKEDYNDAFLQEFIPTHMWSKDLEGV